MNRRSVALLGGLAVSALAATGLQSPASAAPLSHDGATQGGATASPHRSDDRPGPLTKQERALRKAALEKIAKGQASPNADGVVKLGKDKFVETRTRPQDTIFTVLAEFGDQFDSKLGDVAGPSHNEITPPDRDVDNSTVWTQDFSRDHFVELFNGSGESMKNYYESLSNGRYSVVNEVSDWVRVPYNASFYGDNAVEDSGGSWAFVRDSMNAWYDAQLAAGRSKAEVKTYLQTLDEWDRYDYDNDGNFDEADGYLDHVQAVHAGEGEEGGASPDAIWSHRWYVYGTDYGKTGPAFNQAGGTQIGDTGMWVGDYTTEPENGGLGVFAHEYGHDLGLPDYYDTSGGENSTAFWTLMSSGSWLGHGAAAGDGIGTTPGLMGPEEKLFLGWLDHSTVNVGKSGTYTLNPSQYQVGGKDQAVRVNLPDKQVSTAYTTPVSGQHAWWTGTADDLNETLTRPVPAATSVSVSAKAWYDIEAGYDYLYAEYSLDNGATWQRTGTPVDGSTRGRWVALKYAYDAGGKASLFRFRYQTDGGVHEPGAFLDDITVNGVLDNVEGGVNGWTATGLWRISTGTDTRNVSHYYLLENREYVGYDATLQVGPYQFSNAYTKPNWVQFFSFQNGMLVWYVDGQYEDNNVAQHPGRGAAMVVDARPVPFTYPDGSRPSNRRQPFDATFGLEDAEMLCLQKEAIVKGKVTPLTACTKAVDRPAIPTFDDSNPTAYWSSLNSQGSVKVAGHGVKATVIDDSGNDLVISVSNPSKSAS